ncbi:MAG: DNA polymerase I [Bacilli bacterium]|nr:DNA polymerase I [Bacilli bacterium]
MDKVILVDGNNLLFRSYYATAYTGNIMRNSKGFPTNGLYGFVNMINKIINEENPKYMLVAFDIGKTFRHEKYDSYKGGRIETPDELKMQFPVAKEILNAMGIKYLETPGYEADDIIGTFANMIDNDDKYNGLIVSSDKDLLQLISDNVSVKLLKSKDYIMMDHDTFVNTYGIEPIRMIDLKGLMGDPSDNIPGVKGIGEKTALKLLQEYDSVENLYKHIDEIKGATGNKLRDGLESAFMSKEIATIYKEVPVDITIDDIKYSNNFSNELVKLFNELEFYSFIKKVDVVDNSNNLNINIVNSIKNIVINDDVGVYVDMDNTNYHKGTIIGIGIYNKNNSIYIDGFDDISCINGNIYTYDAKKMYVSFKYNNIELTNISDDVMISCYLLNYNVNDDIAYVAHDMGVDIPFYDKKEELSLEMRAKRCVMKAKFIYDVRDKLINDMKHEGVLDIYNDIEMPLSFVLGRMEYTGIRCDSNILDDMGKDITSRINDVSKSIYDLAGCEFNIGSPKQLGDILFNKLEMPHGKKGKSGNYATDEATLSKLSSYPIIGLILEYRMLTKLYSTYIEGLKSSIMEDGKIHTIYTQTLTRTGRLSSIEPNLQNIPIRNEYGKLIRKSFVSDNDSVLLSSDYSQIELRMFSHLANIDSMKEAFLNNFDIHTHTASLIYHVPMDKVTKDMRRGAKAVNFGIIYGISSYGLSQDLGISPKEAKEFIDNYFKTYPGIKNYMDEEIKNAYELGYVKTIMGRKRIINELKNTNYNIRSMGERMALNTPIQGSSADILKMAMIKIDKELLNRNLKSKMLLQIHDELVFNVYNDELDTIKSLVKDIMENIYKLSVPLEVEISIGKDLYEAK